MDSNFQFWFQYGIQHILSIDAVDHILYITALCIAFNLKSYKKILELITAFTIGHSITLLLTALNYININTSWVEFAIPLTIASTCVVNMINHNKLKQPILFQYSTALFFGFIHGMAYGAISVSSLYSGSEAVLLVLAFNLGVELAQLLVVTIVLSVSYIVVTKLKLPNKYWVLCLSSIILCYAIYLAIKNIP